MRQIVFIHGWNLIKDNDELLKVMQTWEVNPFEEKKRRRLVLQERLPEFIVIKPEMPNKDMARYSTWKLWFEKYFQFLDDEELILIGHSLGAMFLVKYFAENQFPKKVAQLHLVAPVLDAEGLPEGDNYLWDFAYDFAVVKNVSWKAEKIVIWSSKDDLTVPYQHSVRIHSQIAGSQLRMFEDKGHFNQAEFPELIQEIGKK